MKTTAQAKAARYATRKRYGTTNEPVGYVQEPITFRAEATLKLSFIDIAIGQFNVYTTCRTRNAYSSLPVVQARVNVLGRETLNMGRKLWVRLQQNGLTHGQQLSEFPLTAEAINAIVEWPSRYTHWTCSNIQYTNYRHGYMEHLVGTATAAQQSYIGCDELQRFAFRLISNLAGLSKGRVQAMPRLNFAYTKLLSMIEVARGGNVPQDVAYEATLEWKFILEAVRAHKAKESALAAREAEQLAKGNTVVVVPAEVSSHELYTKP